MCSNSKTDGQWSSFDGLRIEAQKSLDISLQDKHFGLTGPFFDLGAQI